MISEQFRSLQNERTRYDLTLFTICVALALIIFWQYNLPNAAMKHDMTLQMYAAQIVAEGLPPYVTVGLVKTPLAAIYGAFALMVGNVFGVWDIISVRIAFWLAMALGAGGLYLWASRRFNSRAVGLVAAFAFIGFDLMGKNAVAGPQPKTLMLVSAIYCLLFLQRGRWLWAGLCASLAFLSWQPAAVLMAVALFTPLVDPVKQRGREFLRAALGVTLPIALVVIYLLLQHALVAALQDTFGANLAYLNDKTVSTSLADRIGDNALRLSNRFFVCYPERWVTLTGLVGTLGLAVVYLRGVLVRRDARALFARAQMPLMVYAAVFAGFTLLDFQVCDDTMPFALVLAFGIAAVFSAGLELIKRQQLVLAREHVQYLTAPALVVLLLPTLNAFNDRSQRNMLTLDQQAAVAAQIAPLLGPDDQIQQLGDAGLLMFLHRHNTTKLIFFGPKTGTGVLQQIPGGIEGVIAQLEVRRPKLVALSHMGWRSDWQNVFFNWLNQHYIQQGEYRMYPGQAPELTVYVRND